MSSLKLCVQVDADAEKRELATLGTSTRNQQDCGSE